MVRISGFCYMAIKLKFFDWNFDQCNAVAISFFTYLINLTTAKRLLEEQQGNVNENHFLMNSYL